MYLKVQGIQRVPKGLEGTARYAGLLLAPPEGFGLRIRFFGLRPNVCWPTAKALNYGLYNVSKRYLKVQGIQDVPKGPRYPKGT